MVLTCCHFEPLASRLVSRDPKAQAVAREELRRLKDKPRKKLVPLLAQKLKDKDVEVQRLALLAFQELGATAHPVLSDLILILQGPQAVLRRTAAQAVAKIGPDAGVAAPALLQSIRLSTSAAAAGAVPIFQSELQALVAIGTASLPSLIEATQDKNKNVREAAIEALKIFKATDSAVMSALVAALGDQEPEIRWVAQEALKVVGPLNIPALAQGLSSENANIRYGAALALGDCGEAAQEALEELITALGDNDRFVRQSAARSLAQIGVIRLRPQAMPALKRALRVSKDEKVRDFLKAALLPSQIEEARFGIGK